MIECFFFLSHSSSLFFFLFLCRLFLLCFSLPLTFNFPLFSLHLFIERERGVIERESQWMNERIFSLFLSLSFFFLSVCFFPYGLLTHLFSPSFRQEWIVVKRKRERERERKKEWKRGVREFLKYSFSLSLSLSLSLSFSFLCLFYCIFFFSAFSLHFSFIREQHDQQVTLLSLTFSFFLSLSPSLSLSLCWYFLLLSFSPDSWWGIINESWWSSSVFLSCLLSPSSDFLTKKGRKREEREKKERKEREERKKEREERKITQNWEDFIPNTHSKKDSSNLKSAIFFFLFLPVFLPLFLSPSLDISFSFSLSFSFVCLSILSNCFLRIQVHFFLLNLSSNFFLILSPSSGRLLVN